VLRRTRYLTPRPPDGPVFHAATYLQRSPGWGRARMFARLNRQVESQLETAPGALAYSLQRLLVGRDFWTLSLWSDRQGMLEFVRGGSHRVAAEWLRSTNENVGKFAQWESTRPTLSLDDAYVPLGVPPPKGRVLVAPTQVPVGWRSVHR